MLLFFLALSGAFAGISADHIVFVPLVLGLAAANAFSEEFLFDGAYLTPLAEAVGETQAIMLTAALFGLAHFYGVRWGVSGVLLTLFFDWFLAKSMIETNGFAWAWFLHFLADVVIFSSFAVAAV